MGGGGDSNESSSSAAAAAAAKRGTGLYWHQCGILDISILEVEVEMQIIKPFIVIIYSLLISLPFTLIHKFFSQ